MSSWASSRAEIWCGRLVQVSKTAATIDNAVLHEGGFAIGRGATPGSMMPTSTWQ
jgi:hypothetical protein